MASSASIRPLSQDAISQIKSSIAITSLNDVILELLKNALDAQAHRVNIAVEYGRGSCSVADDGLGIPPAEFQDNAGLGKLYHTSKYDHTAPTYGSRGSFLASVAALSIVSITSRHHKHHSQNRLSINRSQVIARQCPAPLQQHIAVFSHGTRVTVRDLFGNMPVRVKQRAIELEKWSGNGREWDDLRRGVVKLVLAWPLDVVILIKNELTGQKIHFRGPRCADSIAILRPESNLIAHLCNTLSQGLLVSSPEQRNWVPINGATEQINIYGAMSLDPAPTKAVQFISLGIEPISNQEGNNVLYEEINHLFENSSFGSLEEQPDLDEQEKVINYEDRRYKNDGFTSRELRGSKKGTDRWPMYFLKIEVVDPIICNVATPYDDRLVIKGGFLTSIVDLLQAMILEFLKCHHFQVKSTRLSTFRQICPSGGTENSFHESGADTNRDIGYNEKTVQSHGITSDRHFIGLTIKGGSQGMENTSGKLDSSLTILTNRAGSSFSIWPRVKSGRSKLAGKISEQRGETEPSALEAANGKRESSTLRSIIRRNPVSKSSSNFIIPGINHNLAKSGKVIRLPFEDLPTVTPKNLPPLYIRQNNVRISEVAASDGDDETLTWKNPLTNERSLVNVQTGHIFQPMKNKLPSRIVSSNKLRNLGRVSVRDGTNSIEASYPSNERSAWVEEIVRNWKNPIFSPTELGIPQISLEYADAEPQPFLYRDGRGHSQFEVDISVQTPFDGLAGRISKVALNHAQLISQVDKKFILIKIPLDMKGYAAVGSRNVKQLLAIVDQHAADERCHVEDLMAELCSEPCIDKNSPCEAGLQSRIRTMLLEKPLQFVMSAREVELLRTFSQHFANWGILFDLPLAPPRTDQHREERVKVRSLPPGIIERCKTDPKLLIDLLRSEAWRCHEEVSAYESPNKNQVLAENIKMSKSHAWLQRIHKCPRGILDMLNSRSCRSAIMFNDELSETQCYLLLLRLAKCAFPFQCAHGRPSLIPLVDLGLLHDQGLSDEEGFHNSQEPFGVCFKRWKHEMGEMIV